MKIKDNMEKQGEGICAQVGCQEGECEEMCNVIVSKGYPA